MRRAATLAVAAALAAAPARADVAPVTPLAPSAGESEPSPPVREEFGWQIFSADAGALLFTFAVGQIWKSDALVLPYFLTSPVIHVAHRDYVGALESVALHVALPIAGYYIGRALDPPDCTPTPDKWCLGSWDWGPPLGALAGVALATALDAVYLASVERPAVVTARRGPSALPALGVDPSGHVTLSLAGRF